jgi:hypothetical protein
MRPALPSWSVIDVIFCPGCNAPRGDEILRSADLLPLTAEAQSYHLEALTAHGPFC